jgi:septum site-determining protein MinC
MAEGKPSRALGNVRLMTLLRGRGLGLELMLAGRDFAEALAELGARLAERPDFYRGTRATAVVGSPPPTEDQLGSLQSCLESAGIVFGGYRVVDEEVRRRAVQPKHEVKLSDAARSLVADFAGARADIAARRKRGESSVRRSPGAPPKPPSVLQLVGAPPGTLFHTGTLRGGQALHHVGNVVVVGDVNPGTELIATGDVVVFGRLLGVAHAGAHGDADRRVYALHLEPTQLRIATYIAADEEMRPQGAQAEVAFVRDGRIVVVPFSKAGEYV